MGCPEKVPAEELRGIGRCVFMAYAISVQIHPESSTAPGDDEALCEPRERASAILGIVAAFVLGLCIVLAAILAGGGGGLGGGGAGRGGDSRGQDARVRARHLHPPRPRGRAAGGREADGLAGADTGPRLRAQVSRPAWEVDVRRPR